MASPVLGIDLGTTNSVVAYADQNRVRVLRDEAGSLLTPSTVSFHPNGQILVGNAARERRLVDAANTVFSVKRLIGRPFRSPEVRRAAERLPFKMEEGATGGVMVQARGELYSLPEISSFVLRELRRIAELQLQQSCVNAVVTVPANFNELQRMATRDAARIAGLNVLRILNEPTAAALAYGYRASTNQRIAVYDLGGGTFDISILELSGDVIEVVATAGDTYLGGDDIDRLIADRMVAEFLAKNFIDLTQDVQAYERVCLAAEWVKCQLSLLESAEATVQEVAYDSGGKPLDLVFRFARSDLDQMIFKLIGRTFDICEDAMRLAGVRPSQLDGVILVGGQTRTPKVRDMVGEYFGMEPQSSVDPDLVVGQGAALQGYTLAGSRDANRSLHKTLSGTPLPPRPPSDQTLEYAKPRSLAPSIIPPGEAAGFDDQPTTVANRILTPFEDLPTTIAEHGNDEPTKVGESPAIALKSTLTGMGSRIPVPPPSAANALPKPPPIAAIMDSARQSKAATAQPQASVPPTPSQLPMPPALSAVAAAQPPVRTLAETPGAKAGKRPSGAPPKPSVAPASLRSVPPPPRLPSDLAAFPLAMDEVTEEDLPASLKAEMREPPSLPAPAKPATITMAEMPKAKAVQRASVAPPAPSAPPAPATQPSAATQQDPIRTHSMAKLLAAQGHTQRALAIYDELIVKTPWDEKLLQEAKELRNAAAASKPPAPVPATVVSVTPPAPATPTIPAKPAAVAAKSAAAVAKPAAVAAKPATAAAAAPALTPAAAAAALQSSATSRSSSFPAPARMNAPPLLLDVTPHTLAVETAGGYCEQVIERNSPIPTEQTRVFSTSRDNQTTVSMRVSQGEARRTDENQVLGQLELTNLREARRGEVSIAVTFIIDADGTLQVRAQDRATGRTQAIRVNLVGKVEDGEVERARARRGSARPAKK